MESMCRAWRSGRRWMLKRCINVRTEMMQGGCIRIPQRHANHTHFYSPGEMMRIELNEATPNNILVVHT